MNLAPDYLSDLIVVKPLSCTRAGKLITLDWPSNELTNSSISHRAFQYAAPKLWNDLPSSFRIRDLSNLTKPAISYDQFHKDLRLIFLRYHILVLLFL